MEEEARPFIEKHGLKKHQEPGPFVSGSPMVAYSGQINSCTDDNQSHLRVHLVWNGRDQKYKVNNVATTAAAVATYASIAAFHPDLVVSAGTAGGFGELGGNIGDVYASTKCVYHNRRIPEGETGDLEEYGFGHYRSPPISALASAIGIKQGVVSTSDSLECTASDLQLMRSEGAVVKEMEAAACAWVCQSLRVPFIALKSITDIVDAGRPTEKEFYANLHSASSALQGKLTHMLQLLGQQPLSRWAT
eukprot:gene24973-30450_t